MKTTIQNQFLRAEIKHTGAELFSLIKDGKNYIWNIDTQFWDKTSPVLFPVIGGLKDNTFEFEGQKYQLPRHGFAREMDFEALEKSEDSVVFSLKYSDETLKIYPFDFELIIGYYLNENSITVKYSVINHSDKKMYYSIGAHPAFAIDGNFEDYALQFDDSTSLTTHKIYDNLFSGETVQIDLNDKILPLNYDLFAKDAIVLKNSTTKSLTLLRDSQPLFKVNFPDFPYLGIWAKKNAPFICIEPWLGIADNHNHSGKIEEKEGIQVLDGKASAVSEWKVEIF